MCGRAGRMHCTARSVSSAGMEPIGKSVPSRTRSARLPSCSAPVPAHGARCCWVPARALAWPAPAFQASCRRLERGRPLAQLPLARPRRRAAWRGWPRALSSISSADSRRRTGSSSTGTSAAWRESSSFSTGSSFQANWLGDLSPGPRHDIDLRGTAARRRLDPGAAYEVSCAMAFASLSRPPARRAACSSDCSINRA